MLLREMLRRGVSELPEIAPRYDTPGAVLYPNHLIFLPYKLISCGYAHPPGILEASHVSAFPEKVRKAVTF